MKGRHEKATKRIDWPDKLIGALVDLVVGLILLLIAKLIE